VVVVSDDEDRVIFQKRMANDLNQIEYALAPHRDETVGVVVESTYNWYWLVDGLMDAGYRVHLANPGAIKKYAGLKYSGDFADAAYLAQLLRLGLLPEGYIYPREGARHVIWRASVCNWCAAGPPRFCRSRTAWHGKRVGA
jgi:hypothetical protein